MLYQVDDSGDEHPVAFMSHKLNSAQKNYSVTELECLAAVLTIKKFRQYIEGTRFKIITDHASLKWLMSQKDLSGRLARWSLKIQAFDFVMEYRKGAANVVPDALFRMFMDELLAASRQDYINLEDPEFMSAEYSDKRSVTLKNKDSLPDIKVVGVNVFKRVFTNELEQAATWKLWVPSALSDKVIVCSHDTADSAHGGIAKTLEKIRRWFYWPRMVSQIREHVTKCETCTETKAPNYTLRPPMGEQILDERAFQRLYIGLWDRIQEARREILRF